MPDEPSPSRAGVDLQAGYLQILAVLNEARTARTEGDDIRYSLMVGFLFGLMAEMSKRNFTAGSSRIFPITP